MRTSLVIAGLCILLAAAQTMAQVAPDGTPPPAPVLRTPPNGDQLDTHNVRFEWNSVADPSGVTYRIVVFDMSNGVTLHDVSGITGTSINLLLYDSYYSWNVTATDGAGNIGPSSGDSYLLVLAVDPLPPDTTITAPNGGEVLEGGTYFAITWYALDQWITSTPNLKVQIFFSRDNGAHWEQIAQLPDNPGAYAWAVPNIACDVTCLIRVTTENVAGLLGADDSDVAFSIIPVTFADVPPSHFAFSQIEALVAAGITGGCGADNPQTPANEALFCPQAGVTRGQMAVFIETSLRHGPNVCTGTVFSDVNAALVGDAACGYIERFAADGLTAGCGNGKYCPEAYVTRGEMAVFLETAVGNPPIACTGHFTDVQGNHPFCGYVERFVVDGVTAGCGAGKYCVDDTISRAEMAVFIVTMPTPLTP